MDELQLNINVHIFANDSGMHCRLTMTDVSELRRVQRIATEQDNRLRALADALPVFICYLDQDLRVQYSNPEASCWLEYPTEHQLEGRIGDLLGDFENEFSDYLADALLGRRVDFEMRLSKTTEQQRLVQIMLVPDRNVYGKVVGVHVLGIDITEQSKFRQQESRRRLFDKKLDKLTQGEKDVYELLIRGKSNKAIAFELDLGLRTAERRRNTILDKLNVESLGELLQRLGAIQDIESN